MLVPVLVPVPGVDPVSLPPLVRLPPVSGLDAVELPLPCEYDDPLDDDGVPAPDDEPRPAYTVGVSWVEPDAGAFVGAGATVTGWDEVVVAVAAGVLTPVALDGVGDGCGAGGGGWAAGRVVRSRCGAGITDGRVSAVGVAAGAWTALREPGPRRPLFVVTT